MISDRIRQHVDSLAPELSLAIEAAYRAGEIIRAGYGKLAKIDQKDLGDLVSEVDIEADEVITSYLQSKSDLPILSEELNQDTGPDGELWIVDPLDASSAYLMQAGVDYPSVLIAHWAGGLAQHAVGYFPLTQQWYYAQRGRGAWVDGRRLICPPHVALSEVWVEMNAYGNARWESEFFGDLRTRLRSQDGARLVTSSVPNAGVAMRIARGDSGLAVAIHDNDPRSVKQGPWDIAAPQLILEEAGGVFSNADGEQVNAFRAEPFIVARSQGLADEVLELLAREPADR